MSPECTHVHTHTHTHAHSGNRYLGKYILFIKWPLNIYFVQVQYSLSQKCLLGRPGQMLAHMHNYTTRQGTSTLSTHPPLRLEICAFFFLPLLNLLLEILILGHSSNLVQLPSLNIDTDTPSSRVSHLGGKV